MQAEHRVGKNGRDCAAVMAQGGCLLYQVSRGVAPPMRAHISARPAYGEEQQRCAQGRTPSLTMPYDPSHGSRRLTRTPRHRPISFPAHHLKGREYSGWVPPASSPSDYQRVALAAPRRRRRPGDLPQATRPLGGVTAAAPSTRMLWECAPPTPTANWGGYASTGRGVPPDAQSPAPPGATPGRPPTPATAVRTSAHAR